MIAEAADAINDIPSAAEIDIIANFTRDPPAETFPVRFCCSKAITRCKRIALRTGCGIKNGTPWRSFFKIRSATLGVDIHPAARIGSGIMFDHATGIVIGETAVIEDDVVLHSVTLAHWQKRW